MGAGQLLDVEVALQRVLAAVTPLPVAHVTLDALLGRTLAAPVLADADVPAFDRAAMDGVAVVAEGLQPRDVLRQVGQAPAGAPYHGQLEAGTCVRIMTGGVVPTGATAVVPVERIEVHEDGQVRILMQVRAEQNIARQGSEVRAGATVLTPGTVLTGARLGVLATYGQAQAAVFGHPRVVVVPTGDEIVPVTATPALGQVRDANRHAVAGLLTPYAHVVQAPVAVDERQALTDALAAAWDEADVLVTSGGVSAGDRDLVPAVLQSLGAEIHVRQLAIKPGKPFLFGTRVHQGRRQYCFGLPGNPVSSYVCCALFVVPALRAMAGAPSAWSVLHLPSATDLPSTGPRAEILPAQVIDQPTGATVAVGALTSSADLTHFARADWFAWRPAHAPALAAGAHVRVLAWPRPGL